MLKYLHQQIHALLDVFYRTAQRWKKYPAVEFGGDIWMASNLDINTFRNGDIIPEVKDQADWVKHAEEHKPCWCYYRNSRSTGKDNRGKLYNGYAVLDARGLAPEGWHISTRSEWSRLIKDSRSFSELASTSILSILPVGVRNSNGFDGIGSRVSFWTDIENTLPREDLFFTFNFSASSIESSSFMSLFDGDVPLSEAQMKLYTFGFSVRCVKDIGMRQQVKS